MRLLKLVLFASFIAGSAHAADSAEGILGTIWTSQPPKISYNQKVICSANPQDKPQFPPQKYGMNYLRIEKWAQGWIRIVEHNQCTTWFGTRAFIFRVATNGEVFDAAGKKVGAMTERALHIQGGLSTSGTRLEKMIFEVQEDGSAHFFAQYKDAARPGTFEQSARYSRYTATSKKP